MHGSSFDDPDLLTARRSGKACRARRARRAALRLARACAVTRFGVMGSERQGRGGWLSHRLTRAALVVSVPLAVVGGVRAVGWSAAQLKVWADGDTLKAADINGNFTALAGQIGAVTAPMTWTALSLMNKWTPYGGVGYAPPSYARDALGVVHLRGLVTGSTAAQVTIAVLPAGFQPKYNYETTVACGGTTPCTVLIKTTGEMLFELISANSSWLSFDGLTFEAPAGP
jgi:hypothetical protein